MLADIHILHRSDLYRITDFRCHCDLCSVSEPEYNESMCISFIRKGFFEYQTFKRKDEVHAGRILISKPGYDHVTRHIEGQPDITTIFEFTAEFFKTIQSEYDQAAFFLRNNDIHSLLLQSSPDLDYMHHRTWKSAQQKNDGLQLDEMVIELLEKVMGILSPSAPVRAVTGTLKKFHLATVEKARAYILENFGSPISLGGLSQHCLVSPFHFSRIFKSIMNVAPHQYLNAVRLNHAKVLLTTTDSSLADIAFACNFSSTEHFSTAYKKYFEINPSVYRKQLM